MSKKKELNAQELLFSANFLIHMNAYKAAVDAGYAESTAKAKSSLWVGKSRNACPDSKLHVWDHVHDLINKRADKTKIDAELVLVRLGEMMDADPLDIIDVETGCYKPIHEWSLVWRRMLSAADVQELYEGRGEDRRKTGEVVKYRFIDKMKLFELIGKHVDVQAYNEKKTIEHVGDVADRLTRGRNRAPAKDNRDSLH